MLQMTDVTAAEKAEELLEEYMATVGEESTDEVIEASWQPVADFYLETRDHDAHETIDVFIGSGENDDHRCALLDELTPRK